MSDSFHCSPLYLANISFLRLPELDDEDTLNPPTYQWIASGIRERVILPPVVSWTWVLAIEQQDAIISMAQRYR